MSSTHYDIATNDSIKKYLQIASVDSLSPIERDRYNHKAFSLINLSKNDTLLRWYLYELALNFSRTENSVEYLRVSETHYKKSKEVKDTLNLARYYRYRGGFYRWNEIYDSAFYYYTKAEKFYKKTDDSEELSMLYYYKGQVQFIKDDYLGSELSTLRAFNFIKKKKENKFTYDILNTLGNNAHNLKNYKRAILFHKKALKLALDIQLKSNSYDFINTSLNNIGNSYKEQKEFKKAIYYFEKAINRKGNLKNDILIYAYLYNNLGYCKMQLKDYNQLPNLFEKAIRIFDAIGIKNESSISHVYLSKYYLVQKDTIKAIDYAEKSLQLAKEAKAPYYYLIALSNAGYVNKDKAPLYIKEYHEVNDSLQFEQRKVRNQFHKIELETNEITQEREKAIKQKWLMASIITGVLIIVILLFVIYRQRTRQKELKLLQNQQSANEEIYQLMLNQQEKVEEARQIEKKRIGLELHDGIMNRLASTRLNLFVLSKKKDLETVTNCLPYIEGIQQIESEIRNLSHELNKDVFIKSDSFTTLLEELVVMQNNISITNYELQIATTVNWDKVSSEAKMHLYRIVQEAIHNCTKYAKATHVSISFSMVKSLLYLTITDNGIGFNTEKSKEGIGLRNMAQRLKTINGSLYITSTPNKGTTINATIPI